ncbi:small ribosomal subunit nuclear export protein, putative [Plasmodium relictum]|uniref:Small ribosomal subunit nuclear export protein, putative n=1 Tax=Plasmodium relictum TaxID=85471 RepID=A0A1J1HEY4_PLARL|nr:small ribosomal subunit nuclear export protein, putative [Plasmodium relictum]CRH02429.1 small ribosomal subunit nuclear export protein, putative [Plasmodium relictum]
MERSENSSIVTSICSLFNILQTAKSKKCILNSLTKLFLLLYNERIKRKLLYDSNEENDNDIIKLKRIFKKDSVILNTYKKFYTEYEKWLNDCFEKFLKLLFQLLNNDDEVFVKKSLSLLFGSLQCELKIYEKIHEKLKKDNDSNNNNNQQGSCATKAFPFKLYKKIIFNLLKVKNMSVNIVKHICKSYICFYYDLNYFFLSIFKILCIENKKKKNGFINENISFSDDDQKTFKSENWGNIEAIKESDEIINDNYNINLFIYSILINSIKPDKKIKNFHIKKSKFMKQSQVNMFFDIDDKEKIMRRKRKYNGKDKKNEPQKKKGFYNYDSDDSIIHSSSDNESDSSHEDFLDNIDINDGISDINFSDDLEEYDIIKNQKQKDKYKMKERKSNLFINVNIENKLYSQLYSSCWFYFITTYKHNYSMILQLLHSIPLFVFPYTNNPYYLIDYFNFSFYSSSNLYVSLAALPGIFYILTELNIGDLLEESNYCIMNDQKKTKKENDKIKIKKEPIYGEEFISGDSLSNKMDNNVNYETKVLIKIEKKDNVGISNAKSNYDNSNKIYYIDEIKDGNNIDNSNKKCNYNENDDGKVNKNEYQKGSQSDNEYENENDEVNKNEYEKGNESDNEYENEYENDNNIEKEKGNESDYEYENENDEVNKNECEYENENDEINKNEYQNDNNIEKEKGNESDYEYENDKNEVNKNEYEKGNESDYEYENDNDEVNKNEYENDNNIEKENKNENENDENSENNDYNMGNEKIEETDEEKNKNCDIKKLNNNMYTDYYKRLFELIIPASFYYDGTYFLKIIYLSLKNRMIPIHYVISFLKKLLRVSCLTSYNISINILSAVYDILNYFRKDLYDAMFISGSLFMNMEIKNDFFCYEDLNKNFDKNKIIETLKINSKLLKENCKEEKDNFQNLENIKMENDECFMIHKKVKKEPIDVDEILRDDIKKNENSSNINENKINDNFKEDEGIENKGEKCLFSLQDCLPDKYQIDMNILNRKELYMSNQIFYEIILLSSHMCDNLSHYSNMYYYIFNNKLSKSYDFYVDPNKINWVTEESLFSLLKNFLSLKKKKEKDILPSTEQKNFLTMFI